MHFKSFSETVEISGETIIASLKALADYSISIQDMLNVQGLKDVQPGQWYNFQKWLNVLKDVSEKFGPNTIFTLGKGVANNVPDLKLDFESLLRTIDGGYKNNHINGEAGHIELVEFSLLQRIAKLKSYTPYPANYGRGVLVGMIRKFRPVAGAVPKVEVQPTDNEDLNYLVITW